MIDTTSGSAAIPMNIRPRKVRDIAAVASKAANTIPGPSQPGMAKATTTSRAARQSFVAGLSEW